MTSTLAQLLIGHVALGLLGITLFVMVTVSLMRNPLRIGLIKWSAFLGFIAFVASWVTGGYYYATYYGKAVKPVIKAGAYPWAHNFVMEAKEHVFLVLPFLAATVWLVLWLLGGSLETAPGLKRAALLLSWTIVVLGVAITLSGMVISGAVIPK